MKHGVKVVKGSLGGLLLALLVFQTAMIAPKQAEAIPAFARKYKTSCTTCHIAVPKRNAFGEAFRRNGYIMPEGNSALIKQEPVSLGADAWKEVFPNSVWPGQLPAEFPISAYIHQRYVREYSKDTSGTASHNEFDMPHEFEIFLGGTFDETFSYFGEFVLFEKGKTVPGLKRMFLQINDVLGPENAFNVRVGRFEPGITEGLTDNNRVMLEHATALDFKLRGKWRPRNQQSGIEINGILGHRYQYGFGIVNGETKTIHDDTDEKDVYGRVAVKFGGLALDGFQPEGMSDLKQTENWADNALTLGVYAYRGNNASDTANDGTSLDNNFNRIGIDVHGNYNRFDLFAGFISGVDKNPYGLGAGSTDAQKEVNSTAWHVEAYYLVYPWLIPGLRVGAVAVDQNDDDVEKYNTISLNLTMLARANVRFTIEAFLKDYQALTIGGAEQPLPVSKEQQLQWIKVNVMFVL